MRVRAVSLVALLVLAGCTGLGPDGMLDPGGSTVDPDNPWGERSLDVAIGAGDEDVYGPLLDDALDYWEANAEEYLDYPISFERVDTAAAADLVVAFVPAVTGCEDVEEVAGCAPLITGDVRIDRPERVEVLTGLTDESTRLVLKHEFGHVLGLSHGDRPTSIMAERGSLEWRPMPNATERSFPWRNATLAVFVAYGDVPEADRETISSQVGHALAYYEAGAAGHVPANVTFVTVDSRAAADVVITFPDESPCGGGDGSCGSRSGLDADADGVAEWYTGIDITLTGIDPGAVGWHVGYWLGYGLGFDDPADWPAVFRNATAEERRSDWWADGTVRAAPPAVAVP